MNSQYDWLVVVVNKRVLFLSVTPIVFIVLDGWVLHARYEGKAYVSEDMCFRKESTQVKEVG